MLLPNRHWSLARGGFGFPEGLIYVEGFEIYMKLCTTIPTHQGVGTSETTPKDSMYDSSSFAFLQSGSGAFLGMCI